MLTRRNEQGAQQVASNGGMMDEAGQVVNGMKVPVGSMAEEVADDVPAMLSEGEFVIPADVVRFIGLERLMKMRDKAKEGLDRMDEMGQMGNAEEVENPDQPFGQDDEGFEGEIDSIMAEVDSESTSSQTEQMFAAGGYVSGSDISEAPKNPAVDVRYFKHRDGRMIYITYINNRPMKAIPEGFEEVTEGYVNKVGKAADEKAAESSSQTGGSRDTGGGNDYDPINGGGMQREGVDNNGTVDVDSDDPLNMAIKSANTASVLDKVLPAAALMLPFGVFFNKLVNKYTSKNLEEKEAEALNVVGTQLSPFQEQGKVGELGDFKSVKSMTEQFGNNTGVMNGYFLAATDDFTSKVFNDIVANSGAKDLTPAQVGVIGLAIDNAVKDMIANNPNMTLQEARDTVAKDFNIASKPTEAVPDAFNQQKADDERNAAAQRMADQMAAQKAYDDRVAAERKAEADRAAAANKVAAQREAAQQAERERLAAERMSAEGRSSYEASIAETYGTNVGSQQTSMLADQEGGWFAKGGFVRPRKKLKKK